jgi:hypothetical protein
MSGLHAIELDLCMAALEDPRFGMPVLSVFFALGLVKVNAERLRFSIVRKLVRLDVRVESQHIRGVVLLFDLH